MGLLNVESRRAAFEEDPKWQHKAILRLLALTFATASAALLSTAVGLTNYNFTNTLGSGDWTDGIALAPVFFSLLLNAALLVVQFVVRRGRPVHPALPAVGDVLAAAATVPTVVYAVAGGLFWYWNAGLPGDDGTLDCSLFFNAWAQECNPLAYTIGRLEIAGIVFLIILFGIHADLLILSCFDLHRRRRATAIGAQHGFDMEFRKDAEAQSQRS